MLNSYLDKKLRQFTFAIHQITKSVQKVQIDLPELSSCGDFVVLLG